MKKQETSQTRQSPRFPAGQAADLKEKVRRLPDKPGVYLMKDRLGRVIYVGKAKALKKRVSSYFQKSRARLLHPKIQSLVKMIADFETVEVKSEPEALLLEGRLIKQWKPKYNTDFTDDKRYPLVRVDAAETLPRFRLTRFRKDDGARYFGPFPHSGLLRKTLAQMRRQFGVLLADGTPRQVADGVWLLYDDVRRELYGHANEVSTEAYRGRVDAACEFLEGKSREWLESLRGEMLKAAEAKAFERAAELRDVIRALEKTLKKTRSFERFDFARLEAVRAREDAVGDLQRALTLDKPPRTMECFDISHISGTFVVASMVRFSEGRPDKAGYRRYKIRSFVGNDDFRAMEEVVGRRYRRLHGEKKQFPDLVVIDGGAGQVAAALKAFAKLDLEPPALIGLAKKFETVVFSDGRGELRLPRDSAGLRLLQRIRDEAHRFANTFNADLRSKKIRESVLDEFAGLGPKRKAALLEKFGDIARMRAASAAELSEVEGVGLATAVRLKEFLQSTAARKN